MIVTAGRVSRHRNASLTSFIKRWIHCIGCGSDLIPPVSRTRTPPIQSNKGAVAEQSRATEDIITQMSDSQREALNWVDPSGEQLDKHELRHNLQTLRSLKARKSKLCKPCVMSREGTITELYLPSPAPAILGRRFHVLDAMDFPHGVSFTELAENTTNSSDVFVINRCDLVVPRQSQLAMFKRYVMKTVFSPLGVTEDRVHTISAKHGWNLKKLSESFVSPPKQNYFVGPPNSGKTSLVHCLAGTSESNGPTSWPVPFTTQYPIGFRAHSKFRNKDLIDMPSTPGRAGLDLYNILSPSMLRKIGKGQQVMHRDPKYLVTPIRAHSGQTVSIGGLVGLEFPRLPGKQLPIHVFPVINGLNHTNYGQAFHSPEKIAQINASTDKNHEKMRMHTALGLKLEPVTEFVPIKNGQRQSLVIQGLGFLQPFLFGKFPDGYTAVVHAPKFIEVTTRPEFGPSWL